MKLRCSWWLAAAALGLVACGETARLPETASDRARTRRCRHRPPRWIPTVHVGRAKGWPADAKPAPAPGLQVVAFASGLDHPRWLHVLPNGDVLVAETNRPPKPEDSGGGIKDWVMKLMMKKAGAGAPSANRITLLRDADGDGVAETEDGVPRRTVSRRSAWRWSATTSTSPTPTRWCASRTRRAPRASTRKGVKVTDLPAGLNHHWTKTLIASRDGSKLYATVGSNSNVARERHGHRGRPRRHLGDRPEDRHASACSPPACATRTAWRGSRPPGSCGRWSTSATSSAATSCPTT